MLFPQMLPANVVSGNRGVILSPARLGPHENGASGAKGLLLFFLAAAAIKPHCAHIRERLQLSRKSRHKSRVPHPSSAFCSMGGRPPTQNI